MNKTKKSTKWIRETFKRRRRRRRRHTYIWCVCACDEQIVVVVVVVVVGLCVRERVYVCLVNLLINILS